MAKDSEIPPLEEVMAGIEDYIQSQKKLSKEVEKSITNQKKGNDQTKVELRRAETLNKHLKDLNTNTRTLAKTFRDLNDPTKEFRKSLIEINKISRSSPKGSKNDKKKDSDNTEDIQEDQDRKLQSEDIAEAIAKEKHLQLAEIIDILEECLCDMDPKDRGKQGSGGGGSGGSGGSDDDDDDGNGRPRGPRRRQDGLWERTVKANTQAMKGLGNNLIASFNTTQRLTDAVERQDARMVEGFKLGTDTNKLMEANSEILEGTKVGLAETKDVILSNFAAGIRQNSENMNELNQEMIATGQSTQGLENLNAKLLSITGKSIGTVDRLSKVNREVSDKYQISNDRLVETMESLAGVMETAAFFGEDTAAGMGELGTQLQGIVGVDMKGQINDVISLLQPTLENLGTQSLLGITDMGADILEGTMTPDKLEPLFDQIISSNEEAIAAAEGGDMAAAAAARATAMQQYGLSEKQYNSFLQLAKAYEKGAEIEKEARTKEEQEYESIKVARQNANNFFENFAPDIHKGVVAIAPAMIGMSVAINALATAQGVGGMLGDLTGVKGKGFKGGVKSLGKNLLKGAKIATPLAIGAAAFNYGDDLFGVEEGSTTDKVTDVGARSLEYATYGTMIGSIIPGIGNAVGGVVGGLIGAGMEIWDIVAENTEETAEELKKEREEKEKIEAEKKRQLEMQNNELAFMASYIKQNSDKQLTSDPETQELLKQLVSVNQETKRKLAEKPKNVGA